MKYLLSVLLLLTCSVCIAANFINVKQFGAVGNGIADDTKAIQRAIDYCSQKRLKLELGATVSSKYLLTAGLKITSPIYIYGKGTLIKKQYSYFNTLLIVEHGGTTITGISFEGNHDFQNKFSVENSEVYIANCKKITISGCTIKNSPGNGVSVFNSSLCTITKNTIINSEVNAIMLADGASNDNKLTYNTINKTYKQNGIFITASSGSVETNNSINRNIITNNKIKFAGDIGIESSIHANNTYIANNYVESSGNDQILIRDNKFNIVTKNMCVNTGKGNGFSISALPLVGDTEYYDATISYNNVSGAENCGILLGGKRIKAYNNTLSGINTGAGIGVSVQKDDCDVKNNAVSNFGTGIKEFSKFKNTKYSSNKILNCRIIQQLM